MRSFTFWFGWEYVQIEILKRLQREAFSDLMKLRDRQEKVEQIISSYKLSKEGPFQEASTHVKGEVDVLGAMLMMGNTDEESFNGLDREEVRPGLLSRFMFETSLRETDRLVAELVAGYKGEGNHSEVSGNQLSLAKVFYKAEINDWLSAVAIPVGAHFRDIDADVVSSYQVPTNCCRFCFDICCVFAFILCVQIDWIFVNTKG